MPRITLATKRPAEDEAEPIEVETTVDEAPEPTPAKAKAEPVPSDPEPEEEGAPKKTRGAKKKVSTSKAVAKPTNQPAGLDGDFGGEDLQMPYLKLLQPGSDAVEDLGAQAIGHFIHDGAFDLGESIDVVVCGLRKRYKEVTDFDDDTMPRIFDSKALADEEGVEVRPSALIDLAIRVPADSEDAEGASFELGDHAYILARYEVSGRSYAAARSIYTTCRRHQDANLWDRLYSITAKVRPVKGKKYRVPVVTAGVETDQDLRSTIEAGAA